MILTASNYFTRAADNYFMSVSQYKRWLECEFATLAWLKGEYEPEPTDAMLIGSFVHSWADNTLEQFSADHPEMYSSKGPTKGELKAGFQHANTMIATLENDPKVMFFLNGAKEIPLTAELFGVPWKVRLDVDNPELNYIADLKTTKSISEFTWSREHGRRVSFIEEWNYPLQAAVYSEVERLARGRETHRDFYCIAVSKEKVPDHSIIDLTDPARIAEELQKISERLPRIIAVKSGVEKPTRCEHCDYCKATKRVGEIIHYTEMMEAI